MMATYRSLVLCLVLLLVNMIVSSNGLQCYRCGEYNDGVGSITPCLNYSQQNAHNYLKECPRKTDKFCVKYDSELSTVRDCVETCVEKEVWETATYCCNTEGCNGSTIATISRFLLMLATILPLSFLAFINYV